MKLLWKKTGQGAIAFLPEDSPGMISYEVKSG
jgi:hypothetical protein